MGRREYNAEEDKKKLESALEKGDVIAENTYVVVVKNGEEYNEETELKIKITDFDFQFFRFSTIM